MIRIPQNTSRIGWDDLNPLNWGGAIVGGTCKVVRNIPFISALVQRTGCSPVGRAAAETAIAAASISSLGPAGYIVGQIGAAAAIECACGASNYGPGDVPAPEEPWWKSPWPWIGVGAAVLGTTAFVVTRKPKKKVVRAAPVVPPEKAEKS